MSRRCAQATGRMPRSAWLTITTLLADQDCGALARG